MFNKISNFFLRIFFPFSDIAQCWNYVLWWWTTWISHRPTKVFRRSNKEHSIPGVVWFKLNFEISAQLETIIDPVQNKNWERFWIKLIFIGRRFILVIYIILDTHSCLYKLRFWYVYHKTYVIRMSQNCRSLAWFE